MSLNVLRTTHHTFQITHTLIMTFHKSKFSDTDNLSFKESLTYPSLVETLFHLPCLCQSLSTVLLLALIDAPPARKE